MAVNNNNPIQLETLQASETVVPPRSLEDVCHQADAYASFANISALIFGFALSVIWNENPDSSKTSSLYFAKIVLLSIAICLAGFALVVHAIQYYAVKELVSKNDVYALEEWIKITKKIREYARYSMWYSLGSFMLSTACHLVDALDSTLAGISAGLITAGICLMGWAVLYMRPKRILRKIQEFQVQK